MHVHLTFRSCHLRVPYCLESEQVEWHLLLEVPASCIPSEASLRSLCIPLVTSPLASQQFSSEIVFRKILVPLDNPIKSKVHDYRSLPATIEFRVQSISFWPSLMRWARLRRTSNTSEFQLIDSVTSMFAGLDLRVIGPCCGSAWLCSATHFR